MVETAKVLATIAGKTIVLTGALNPERFRGSAAEFNIGCAVGAVQSLPPGVHIAINGRIWDPLKVRKNVDANKVEALCGRGGGRRAEHSQGRAASGPAQRQTRAAGMHAAGRRRCTQAPPN